MPKVEHIWSLLCEKSVTDNETNNISLYNVLERVQITPPKKRIFDSKEKVISLNFELVTLWRNLSETGGKAVAEVKIDLIDPDGKILGSVNPKIEILRKRLRYRTRFNGLKVTTPGYYTFSTKLKNGSTYDEVGKTYLEVEFSAS